MALGRFRFPRGRWGSVLSVTVLFLHRAAAGGLWPAGGSLWPRWHFHSSISVEVQAAAGDWCSTELEQHDEKEWEGKGHTHNYIRTIHTEFKLCSWLMCKKKKKKKTENWFQQPHKGSTKTDRHLLHRITLKKNS